MKIDVKKICFLPDSERFKYLRENERDLIKTKCSSEITSDVVICSSLKPTKIAYKALNSDDNNSIMVKVVANTSNWIDSQLDMIIPGAVDKSLKERKGKIPHLHDHERSTTAKVGEVVDIYTQDLSFSELGILGTGIANVLIFETNILKDYNENIFNQYKNGGINQHSIGLRYINMVLAMNDVNDPEHLKNWNEYINQAINRDVAEKNGFFWVVKEYKLIENSAVLFGANEITPTLSTSGKNDYEMLEDRIKALELKAAESTLNDKPLSDVFLKQTINSIKNIKF
jgi:hypothetical protein